MKIMQTLEGGLRLDAEDADDWLLLTSITNDAVSGDENLARRLGKLITDPQVAPDWRDYVVPDLEDAFNADVQHVTTAIASARLPSSPNPNAPSTRSPSAKSCSASIPAKAASAPPANSPPGKAAANTTPRAACANASAASTAVVTAFVDNEVGHLVEDFIMQGGVATDFIQWREDDGIGRKVRNGLNFTERGFGIRGAVGNPTAATPPPPSSSPATSIGTTSSANSACAGSTPAASSPRSRKPPPPSPSRP
jgi:hypothetical protein